jgi:hypothetical protein
MVALFSQAAIACCYLVCLFIGATSGQNITNDSFFYGQSPAVLPSREYTLGCEHDARTHGE